MQPSNTFYLDKSTDPFADTLATHGLATVLRLILERAWGTDSPSVRITDGGAYYRFDCNPHIDDEVVTRACSDGMSLFPAIRTLKNGDSLADLPHGWCVDYEAERDRRAAYFEWLKALPRDDRTAVARGEHIEGSPEPPHRHWDIFRAVNPAALAGHNALALGWWKAHAALPQALDILLGMTSQLPPNDMSVAVSAWKELDRVMGWEVSWDASALQLFNPSQGKGQNRAKANNLSMGNMSGFWLLEWLKVAGLYEAGLTRSVGDDRKSYALSPLDIAGGHIPRIMGEFRRAMLGADTAVRSDIMAALRFTRVLLSYAEQNQGTDLWAQLMGGARPRDIVSGFQTAFYKNLGNSTATMNLSFIALPGWVLVENAGDVAAVIELLDEHEQIVRQLDESHSDDVAMLQDYRDFLSGDDLGAFFDFTTAYASFVIGRRERGLFARQLTTDGIERLLMSTQTNFYEIVQNEGFQHVAYAIRQSTVTAQFKKQQGDRRYDVRYGLNHALARAANRPETFLAALSDFMGKFNAENAQVMEKREGPYRTSLTTSDIEEIVALVDQYGARVICNLLIAYGYARLPREQVDTPQEQF